MAYKQSTREQSPAKGSILNIITAQTASQTKSISDAVVIKDDNIFFLSRPDGSVPMKDGHGYGLYYNDCRYLNGFELTIAGKSPEVLVAAEYLRYKATYQLTNPNIHLDEDRLLPKQTLGIRWERLISSRNSAVYDVLTFHNYGKETYTFPVRLAAQVSFDDVFNVRGQIHRQQGIIRMPHRESDNTISFMYEGEDGIYRNLLVHCEPSPQCPENLHSLEYEITLKPQEEATIRLTLDVRESDNPNQQPEKALDKEDYHRAEAELEQTYQSWIQSRTMIDSDNHVLNAAVNQSFRDLRVLMSTLEDQTYFAAGIPWFATLFGRDSVITAIQTLIYDTAIAEQTLRILAHYQGKEVNKVRDEQPGKMLHEFRMGELTQSGFLPYDPYYGSIDSTPLFLMLVGYHSLWTGRMTMFDELRDSIEKALAWIDEYGDLNGDGYVEYHSMSEKGLYNQGWKDSGDGVVNKDGSLAESPIALVEVQGYVYEAKRMMAMLYRRSGDTARADRLIAEAESLKERFNRDFWQEHLGFYALALQADQRPARVVSSNPGHALWSGIVDDDRAARVVRRLMADDMFSGWGIRTLSTQEQAYNPVGYHLGTVWPHDNAIIAAGFKRYGFDEPVIRVFGGILEAAMFFKEYQLPEVFAGFGRDELSESAHYPVAAHPQAWAAGSIPFFITTMLGLKPNAFERHLRIVRPVLPDLVDRLMIKRLRVGETSVDLQFVRTAEGTAVNVLAIDGGPLKVTVDLTLTD